MEFGVVIPQNGDWKDIVSFAQQAEAAGFDSVWVIDHLVGFPPERGLYEAWTVMSALASATERVGIGAQVLCQSFRSPGLLAKMATTLDVISDGRLRFVIGAGWLEMEYTAFGYQFPSPGRRVAELEDAVRICRGMFDAGSEPFSYEGRTASVQGAINTPAPGRRIPIGVGGGGDRMLDLTARLADEWNSPAILLGALDDRLAHLDKRIAAAGRQASEVKRSAQIVFHPGDEEPPPGVAFFQPHLGLRGSTAQMSERVAELAGKGLSGLYGVVAGVKQLDAVGQALPELRAAAR